MKRLCHVITTLDPGGAENALLDLCRGLKNSYQQDVVFLKGRGKLKDEFKKMDVPVKKIAMETIFDLPSAKRQLRQHTLNTQIVHSHLLKANTVASLACSHLLLLGTRHNDEEMLNNFFIRYIHRTLSKYETTHIAISKAVKDFYVGKGLKEDNFEIVPYGFAATEKPEVMDLISEFELPAGQPVLLHAGRLVPQKDQLNLIKVMAEIPDVSLLICGEGPLEEHLKANVTFYELENRVKFLGFRKDLPRLMASADLFVLPSLFEGLGRVLLECMAYGLPVVATNSSAIPEVLGNTAWLCAAGNHKALSKSIQEALSEKSSWPSKIEDMKQRLEEKFSMNKMIDAHLQIYKSLIDG